MKADRKRPARRYRFAPDKSLPIRVRHPGGTEIFIRIVPRAISEEGMEFLHGGYLHCGTTCEFMLHQKSGDTISIVASVVRCNHAAGRIHEVGLAFTTPVEMSAMKDVLVDDAAAIPSGQSQAGQGAVRR